MPVPPHETLVFAVKDAKIRPVTDDAAGGITYGTAVDVPGIKSVTVSGEISTAEARGDNRRLGTRSTLAGLSVAFGYAKLSLDALAVMLGGTVTDTAESAAGAGDATAAFAYNGDEEFGYFQFQAVSAASDTVGGDVLFELNKVVLSEFPELGMAEEDFAAYSVTAQAQKPLATATRTLRVVHREKGGLL